LFSLSGRSSIFSTMKKLKLHKPINIKIKIIMIAHCENCKGRKKNRGL
jgi:hypothetical protein